MTPFEMACKYEATEAVKLWINYFEKSDQTLDQIFTQYYMNPLHMATNPKNWPNNLPAKTHENLQFLLTLDINVFAEDSDGWTPFEIACKYGLTRAFGIWLKYFEDRGIKINQNGMLPLICACMRTDEYDQKSEKWTPLHTKTYDSRSKIVKDLIEIYKSQGFNM